jgi:lactate racemase
MSTAERPLRLRYGEDVLELLLDPGTLLFEAGASDAAPTEEPGRVVVNALDSPIGSEPLATLARGKRRVVVVIDDLTRPTPASLLLPDLLAELASAGVPEVAVQLLVATGTHRPMTDSEIEGKIGAAVAGRYEVVNHDYRRSTLVDLGRTPSGIPVALNAAVTKADLVVGVGNIVPHRYCGWAGGAKIIQPGVSGEATTAGTHLMITRDPGARLGVVENSVRREIEAVAEHAHLRFIVNTVLNRHGDIVDVVAGDPRDAFRAGVERARGVHSAEVPDVADIVLASSYPSDLNLWQAGKGLYSADVVVRDGGIIILASPCYEGVGEHDEFADLLRHDYVTLARLIDEGSVRDRIAAAAALAVAVVTGRAEVWLATRDVTEDEARRMQMKRFRSVEEALAEALARIGPTARVGVLHEATEIAPVISR